MKKAFVNQIRTGDVVDVTIEDMSVEGQGIARIKPQDDRQGDVATEDGSGTSQTRAGGLVLFVDGAVKGDRVKAEITGIKKNFAFAKAISTLEESPLRSEDFDCPGYEKGCGGCPLGKLSYEAQLETKEYNVRSRLERIAGIRDPYVKPIIGMDDSDNEGCGCWRYRNKAVFPVSTGGIITKKGGIVEALAEPSIGFFKQRSNEVVDCGDCYLQSMAAMAAADALRRFMTEDNITGYDPRWERGLIRNMTVRTAFGTGEVMVVIGINGKGIPGITKLVDMLDDSIAAVGCSLESVVYNIKRASGKNVEKHKTRDRSRGTSAGTMPADRYQVVAGRQVIEETLGDLRFEISPASFFQVNPAQMKRLYDVVRKYCEGCEDSSRPVILDLYCGVGSIGLYCADLAEMVVGIESVKEAVVDANRNATINGIVNTRYICGRAEEVLSEVVNSDRDEARISNRDEARTSNRDDARALDPELRSKICRADIAILDPPRAGCRRELLDAIVKANIPRIVYVSCDPATLARDIRILTESGYGFIESTPVDMFPHTGHVESCVLLERVSDR